MNYTRSKDNNYISGVCGGLGEYTGIDPIIWRILFVLFASPILLMIYITVSLCTEEK